MLPPINRSPKSPEGARRPWVRVLLGLQLLLVAAGGSSAQSVTDTDWAIRLLDAAIARTERSVRYDGAYVSIPYPGGDVADDTGVCTDLVIRSYRALGFDLQEAVHEDMKSAFSAYPSNWGLLRPDPNIDHRRVPNLQTYFTRHGLQLPAGGDPDRYRPGDLVTWMLPGNLPHIGIVSNQRSVDGTKPLIVHNIGRGPVVDDSLFAFPITGHYRFAVTPLESRP